MSERNVPSGKIKTIIVVEDNIAIGEMLVQILKYATPYEVLHVTDGFQALKVVRDIKPDLFVLDYQLPRMDGIELYDHLQEAGALKDTSTLFMSAEAPMDELKKRQVPFIEKPFKPNVMVKTLKALLHE